MRNVYRAMLVLLLVLGVGGMASTPARAADQQSIVVESKQGNPGDAGIEIPIKVVHNPGVNSLELTVTYDTTRLRLKEEGVRTNAEWGGSILSSPPDEATQQYKGEVVINWVATADYTVDISDFITLYFDILEDAPAGPAKIEVSCGEGTGSSASEYLQFNIINGVITVLGDPGEISAKIVAGTAVCKPGDTGIAVPIRIVNNPGVNMIQLNISYNGSALILRDIQLNSSDWKGLATPTIPESKPDRCTALLTWVNTNVCSVNTSTFATLTFDISDTAVTSVYPIEVAYDADSTGNDDDNVAFVCQNGSITVEANGLSATLQPHNNKNVTLAGSTEVLSDCVKVFAAHYNAGMKMDAIAVSTQISDDKQTLTFSREVGSGWWLFFLDSQCKPVYKKLPIS